jgi:hypothetical protein
MHYKDLQNKLHWIDSIADEHFLPAGSVAITDEEANVIRQANAPQAPRITRVTMRQARLALLGAGLLSTVNSSIAAMTGSQGDAARIEWEYSQEVQRDRGLVLALGTQLGMTEAQLDALFAAAAAIP